MISLDTAVVVTWSGRESSNTMTLRTLRGGHPGIVMGSLNYPYTAYLIRKNQLF